MIFHQHMPRVTQLFMRCVGPLLPVKVHREVAAAGLRRLAVSILALETRGSRPGLQQRLVYRQPPLARIVCSTWCSAGRSFCGAIGGRPFTAYSRSNSPDNSCNTGSVIARIACSE